MEMFREMAAVAAVLGLLGGALWFLRRRGALAVKPFRRGAARRLECIERVALGPQHALHLVRVGDRGLLVGSGPSGCVLIESFSWRETLAQGETRP